MIILTDAERGRFAEYLKQEATTANGMLEQMKKMAVAEAVQKKYKTEIAACIVVRTLLISGEEVAISG